MEVNVPASDWQVSFKWRCVKHCRNVSRRRTRSLRQQRNPVGCAMLEFADQLDCFLSLVKQQ